MILEIVEKRKNDLYEAIQIKVRFWFLFQCKSGPVERSFLSENVGVELNKQGEKGKFCEQGCCFNDYNFLGGVVKKSRNHHHLEQLHN